MSSGARRTARSDGTIPRTSIEERSRVGLLRPLRAQLFNYCERILGCEYKGGKVRLTSTVRAELDLAPQIGGESGLEVGILLGERASVWGR